MIGVYSIVHKASGRMYIGSSVNIESRIAGHVRMLRKATHGNKYLQHAWSKYGEAGFCTGVLEQASSEDRIAVEQRWIDAVRASDARYGFNLCPIAGNVGRLPKSAEHKRKIGAAHKGSKRTPEARAKISAAKTGHVVTEATRRKHSLSMLGKNKGARTEEVRRKISASLTGRKIGPMSAEHKAKIAASTLGKKKHPRTQRNKEQ